jgi:hypothetical protein
MTEAFTFSAILWEHDGTGAWHFVTLPEDVSDEIADLTEGRTHGFGSVRVSVTVGGTTWGTSLFPDSKAGAYVLPVKKAVRAAEGLMAGDPVELRIILE